MVRYFKNKNFNENMWCENSQKCYVVSSHFFYVTSVCKPDVGLEELKHVAAL
jgi:hypothetical protein